MYLIVCEHRSTGPAENNAYLVIHDALPVPGPAPFGEVVDSGKLNQGRENEGVADSDKPVHGCGVRYLGQRVTGTDTQRSHSEHSGHTCKGRTQNKMTALGMFHTCKL